MTQKDAKQKYGQNLHKEHIEHDGLGTIENCVPACKRCNSSKRKNKMEDWFKKQDFYTEGKLQKIIEWRSKFA